MDLRIDETVASHSIGLGDELAFGSHTKAHAIQLIDDRVHDGIIPVEEAEEMKRGVRYVLTYPCVAAMPNQDP